MIHKELSVLKMNYWIICITKDNLDICFQEKVVGFVESKRKRLKSFRAGDLITFYVSRMSLSSNKKIGKFMGLAKIEGKSYQSTVPIWKHGLFPERIAIELMSQKSCDVKILIEDLNFIGNKVHWGAAFLPGIIRVSQVDFEVIQKSLMKSTATELR
jgi:predicted RNA-binding protein